MYIAKHKVTGKEFKDYKNVSGVLTSYIKNISPLIIIPSKFIRNSYNKKYGKSWHEQYFDILEVDSLDVKKTHELSQIDILEIVRLYTSKEINSTHKLASMFKVGHKKISEILKVNKCEINPRGGLKIYPEKNILKYTNNDDSLIYKAVNKETGVIFDDYNNISGALTRYISKTKPELLIPILESEKNRYLLNTGSYWYEQFFDIVLFKKSDLKLKKCPYCDSYIDISISDIKYKNHLKNEHNIDIEEHVTLYPTDINIFTLELDSIIKAKNNDNWVECKICGLKFGIVNSSHLKKHNISVFDYKLKYGNNVSLSTHESLSLSAIKMNESGVCISYVSKPEKDLGEYLKSLDIPFEVNRKMLIGKEIDILSHDNKIGIEFNGCKWHTEWFGGKDKLYHLNKTINCNNKNYSLIHIFEDEWFYRNEIVKHKLKQIFNKNNNLLKIGARNTIIRKIDISLGNEFLDKYHIQGSSKSTVYLGSFYEGKLIAVMSFKELIKGSSKYDLTRFASDYNYICQGVGSKMLSYFIKNYNPDSIISFADRRWTLDKNSNLYTKLEFKLVSELGPDYRYYNTKVDRYKRFHKFGFRKQILHKKYGLDLSLTETEMIKILGYDRIWDCGLFKYEWKKGGV